MRTGDITSENSDADADWPPGDTNAGTCVDAARPNSDIQVRGWLHGFPVSATGDKTQQGKNTQYADHDSPFLHRAIWARTWLGAVPP